MLYFLSILRTKRIRGLFQRFRCRNQMVDFVPVAGGSAHMEHNGIWGRHSIKKFKYSHGLTLGCG